MHHPKRTASAHPAQRAPKRKASWGGKRGGAGGVKVKPKRGAAARAARLAKAAAAKAALPPPPPGAAADAQADREAVQAGQRDRRASKLDQANKARRNHCDRHEDFAARDTAARLAAAREATARREAEEARRATEELEESRQQAREAYWKSAPNNIRREVSRAGARSNYGAMRVHCSVSNLSRPHQPHAHPHTAASHRLPTPPPRQPSVYHHCAVRSLCMPTCPR